MNLPQIQLDPIGHILCSRHGEPFRAEWPGGIAAIIVMGLEFIQASEELVEECGGDLSYMTGRLTERPVCERVEADRLLKMYQDAMIGKFDLCDVCGVVGLGTPYAVTDPRTVWKRKPTVKKYQHVCFKCVLTRTCDTT